VKFAIAVFVDKSPDHVDDGSDAATLLGAYAARAVWNQFTGMNGLRPGERQPVGRRLDDIQRGTLGHLPVPGRPVSLTPGEGTAIKAATGLSIPYFPHYADSSIVVVVPDGFRETQMMGRTSSCTFTGT
jgi:hypothetical protein